MCVEVIVCYISVIFFETQCSIARFGPPCITSVSFMSSFSASTFGRYKQVPHIWYTYHCYSEQIQEEYRGISTNMGSLKNSR